jgi:hypothetical protein
VLDDPLVRRRPPPNRPSFVQNELYTYLDTDDNRILEVKFNEDFWTRGKFDAYPGVNNPWKGRPKHAPFDQPFYIIFNVAVGACQSCAGGLYDGLSPSRMPCLVRAQELAPLILSVGL